MRRKSCWPLGVRAIPLSETTWDTRGKPPDLTGGVRDHRLVTSKCEVENICITNQGHNKRFLYGACVGDIAHDGGDNRASDDGHDQQSRTEFCVHSETLHTEREDGREHDGIKKTDHTHAP